MMYDLIIIINEFNYDEQIRCKRYSFLIKKYHQAKNKLLLLPLFNDDNCLVNTYQPFIVVALLKLLKK